MCRAFARHPRHSQRHTSRHTSRHKPRHAYSNNKNSKILMGGRGCNAHAYTRTHTRKRRRRRARPAASPRRGNRQQLRNPGIPLRSLDGGYHPSVVAESSQKCKKVAESFGGSKFFRTFAPMNEPKFIITGINRLTHRREQLSRPMNEQEASERLQREVANRKYQRHAAHIRLKMQRLDAVQLTFNFNEHEE